MSTPPRNTRTITFSMSPEMTEEVQRVMREEGRTISELIRQALRNYIEEREWIRSIRRERVKAKEKGRETKR